MTKEQIEEAVMVLADFWDAEEQAQEEAIETASKILNAILRMMEG